MLVATLNPMPHKLKYNLFHGKGGEGHIYPSRNFVLSEPIMHRQLRTFIHIKFKQFVGHRIGQQAL